MCNTLFISGQEQRFGSFLLHCFHVQRVIIIVRGELPPRSDMEEDLQKYISMNTYLDSQDPWFWHKLRWVGGENCPSVIDPNTLYLDLDPEIGT